MTRLEKLIAALQRSLGIQKPLRERARRRMLARHRGQVRAERQAAARHREANSLHREGKTQQALRREKTACALERKASKERDRAIFWKGRTRILTKRIEGIEHRLEDAKRELVEATAHVDFNAQKVIGGRSFAERWVVSNVASWQRWEEGIRAGRYSQAGTPQIRLPYGPGPWSGRDDCSSYGTSQALATGADDPNGRDFSGEGFTGTMAEAHGRWKQVSKAEMIAAGQGFVVYGPGSGHHTEMYAPSKTDRERTIGHGTAAVDPGTIHIFGPNEYERYFIFVP